MPRARTAASILAVLVVLALAACGAPAPVPTLTPTPVRPSGDGTLRIATVLASSDPSSAAQIAGVEVAVRELNEAGGWGGLPVEVLHRNAGDDSLTAVAMVESLSGLGVDLLIAGSSSPTFAALVPVALDSGAVAISPTASSTSEAFSFAPVVGLDAAAVAAVLPAGSAKIAVLATDDASVEAIESVLSEGAPEVVLSETLSADTPATALAARVAQAKPDSVIILGGPAELVAGLIDALAARNLAGGTIVLVAEAVTDYSSLLQPSAVAGAVGIRSGVELSPVALSQLLGSDPGLGNYSGAAEAHDAVIAAALAAVVADDDGGRSIASELRRVVSGPVLCASYAECLDVLDAGHEIAFAGWSGVVRFDSDGNRAVAPYSVYRFTAENRPEFERAQIAE